MPGIDGAGPTRRDAGNLRGGGRRYAQMRMADCGRGFACGRGVGFGCGAGNVSFRADEDLYLQKTILQERLAAVEKQIQSVREPGTGAGKRFGACAKGEEDASAEEMETGVLPSEDK